MKNDYIIKVLICLIALACVSSLSVMHTSSFDMQHEDNEPIQVSMVCYPEITTADVLTTTEDVTQESELIEPNETKTVAYNLSESEIIELATLVYLEAGSESYECQKAIASVVLNRMSAKDVSLHTVIYAPNQFTPANRIKYTKPSNMSIEATRDVVTNGNIFPKNVLYFREGYYFNWGPNSPVKPYKSIDHVYFSMDISMEE